MSVPDKVPANVPAGAATPAKPKPARASRSRSVGTVPHLTREGDGWRFQMRVPAALIGGDFRLAGRGFTVRASLGPRGRGEARRLARQLATVCDTVFALAAAQKDTHTMAMSPQEQDLAHQVIAACQTAIGRALKQPAQAVGLARGLNGALTSLLLVQSEIAKGERGARAVVDNADALARNALTDVLKLSAQPDAALAALAAVPTVAPPAPPTAGAPAAPRRKRGEGEKPKFGEVSRAYIDMRIEKDGADHPDISTLEMRRQTFIDVVDDFPVDEYYPSDLQKYVNRMQFWPANVTKRSDAEGKTTLQILEANKEFTLKPMALKTMQDGYVANVRTMMRHGMMDYAYRDPFAGVQLSWPDILRASLPREDISVAVTNRVFRDGVDSGLLDEAMLPLLAKLTSRRLGLLTYLQGSDIRQKHGVWVAQTSGIVCIDGRWQRTPIKTAESMTFFVLNNFLVEIGFVDWARARDCWIFAAVHEHPDPSKYASKTMGRLLRRNGAKAGEVFHSLRGDAIDEMREADVDGRTRRLQAGHQLGDEHEKYGHRALKFAECQRLAHLPLPEGIDWEVFRELDFDAMAARRRSPGRRRR